MTPPDLIPFTGDWESYVDAIYKRYHNDIIQNRITLWGKPVNVRWVPESKGKPFNFWHVVSEGDTEEERTPDLNRCARIGWIAWAINCCNKNLDCVRWYLSERSTGRGRKTNLVIWAPAEEYVVIVEPREGFALLVSAYPVRGRRSDKLAREYAEFAANPKPIPNW